MKLHYSIILLFSLPLNILEHNNNNEPYMTSRHTPRYISRVLSEGDTQSSSYDNDPQMKKVMKKFQDRTSQRLREYDERMKGKRQKHKEQRDKNIQKIIEKDKRKRQKHKEQRDKNIQKIIEKDKREKSLVEKVEKGCLRCGCALGGGVLPVWGLVSGLWYATLSQHVTKLAIQKGIEKGIEAGLAQMNSIFQSTSHAGKIPTITTEQMLSSGKFTNSVNFYDMAKHINSMRDKFQESMYDQFWLQIGGMVNDGGIDTFNKYNGARIAAVSNAFEKGKAAEFASHTSLLSNTIIASVVTILVIVLVMIIIYLILRYRRKKKMKKKAQYTKLLNK
ncbi:rifin [Plasmodium reichenowi]|uniref:Rifin n=1 Tax=Plasmodium reichenowi TaxID=5854 RepID=A0A060RMG9_PLARE|nr:rifin [Plasmodium reichenowi]